MPKTDELDTEIVNRNLQFPRYVWDALDKDASRCQRSGAKQLLALLLAHYDLGDVELDQRGLDRMEELSSSRSKKQRA